MALNERTETAALVKAILEKKWEDFEAMEYAEYLLFPDELLKRKKDGTFERTPIMLRVPREHETRKARLSARKWADDEGLDPSLDPDCFDNMDTMCTLSVAIRNTTEPYEAFEPDPKRLERIYDRPCLDAIWAKLGAYRSVLDPRPNSLNADETLAVIGVLAKTRNIAPLAALGGESQNNLIVTMAVEYVTSRTSKS
jgi:hypothetical protein